MPKSQTYQLVNPFIKGDSFDDSVKSTKSYKQAAEKMWKRMSQYHKSNLPSFAFTLKNKESDEMYHFKVEEKVNKDDSVRYNIKRLKMEASESQLKKLHEGIEKTKKNSRKMNKIAKKKMSKKKGGRRKRYDDSDSDSDSDSDMDESDFAINLGSPYPLNYWSYYPSLYDGYLLDGLYIPNFVYPTFTDSYFSPYIYII
jgi:hypothetical protein